VSPRDEAAARIGTRIRIRQRRDQTMLSTCSGSTTRTLQRRADGAEALS